jgi:phytoene dehydrogenase-like protein
MSRLTRRSFLAAASAIAASPALGATQQKSKTLPGEPRSGLDVVIVGAGVAGIAAARRIMAANRKCVVLEATGAVGGRCTTDTALFGVPYDRGARALHTPETNPVARLALQNRFDVYPAPPGQRMRITRRYARESEMEDMLSAMVRANAALADASRKADIVASQALPKDLGEWRSTAEFMMGPYYCGKDLT